MDRRRFICLSVGALSAGTASALEPSHAARLGAEILRQRLIPADAAALRVTLGVGALPVSDVFSRDWKQDIRNDFGAGRTVTVTGWMLSETEARLCTLAALEEA
jgi:hypothetical protein